MTIWFDMDGTIADLYKVSNWLPKLRASDPSPYEEAKVLMNMSLLARKLNQVRSCGYSIGIISWGSKEATTAYDEAVTAAKIKWLKIHLRSVTWDTIHIVHYGTAKTNFRTDENDILFDDEVRHRDAWGDKAYSPNDIIKVLKGLIEND